MIFPDRVGVFFFINPDKAAFLFHTDIAGDHLIITDNRQFSSQISKFRNRFGHKIMMRHRSHRQLQAGPFAHLACISTAGIDHMFTSDRTLFGFDQPFTIGHLGDVGRPATADDVYAQLARPKRHRHGHVRGVHMTIIRGMQRTQNAVQIIERVQRSNPVRAHKFNIKTKRAADRQSMPQPVHFIFGIGQPERATSVPGHSLAGFRFQRTRIQPDIVINTFAQTK